MQPVEFSTRWISSWVVASPWPPWNNYSLCFYRSFFKTKADNNWLFEANFYQILIPQWWQKQSKIRCKAPKRTKYLKNIWQQYCQIFSRYFVLFGALHLIFDCLEKALLFLLLLFVILQTTVTKIARRFPSLFYRNRRNISKIWNIFTCLGIEPTVFCTES